MPVKPKFTLSTGPIAGLISTFQDWLYLPDPGPLYAVVGALIANMLPGDPVWLMLVGPPSSGKTEIVWSFRDLPDVYAREEINGPAGLLSAVGKKDTRKGATGGLLREMGDFGILLMKDFTSILLSPRDDAGKLLGALQHIYDGHWSREVGTEGGKVLEWPEGGKLGKMGLLSACTNEIDSYHPVVSAVGPRFLYYRLPMTDGDEENMIALDNENSADMREDLADAVSEFVEGIDLEEEVERGHRIAKAHKQRLSSMGILASRGRSSIKRDSYSRNDILLPPSPESPMRVSRALGQVLRGMRIAGIDEHQTWRVLSRIAVDSLPLVRRRALMTVHEADGKAVTVRMLTNALQCGSQTTRRTMEDLSMLGMVEIERKGKELSYGMTKWASGRWKAAFPRGVRSALMEDI